MLKDEPLVLFAKAGRGSLCEQEEEKLLPSVAKCGKSGFYTVSEKDKFHLESEIYTVLVNVIVAPKSAFEKNLEKLISTRKVFEEVFFRVIESSR